MGSAVDVRLGVLGPLRAEVDGREAPLGGPRQRSVLATLIIARGAVVTADRIVSQVWEGSRTPSPTTLHACVSGLRRVLEPRRAARAPAGLLVREGPGYALRIDPAAVDAEEFAELAVRGRRALDAGEPEGAQELLGRALALWRGPAYADLADAGFAAPERARLEELRATAAEDRLAAAVRSGQHGAAVGELEAMVAEQPLRERGWELLALALYRSGRQAEALAALRTLRRRLADDLGIEPGAGPRAMEAAILAQDPVLLAAPAGRPRPGTVTATGAAAGSATGAAVTTGTAPHPAAASAAAAFPAGAPDSPVRALPVPASPAPAATATATGPRARTSARSAAAPVHGNLPFATSGLVGRGTDLAAVGGLLAEHRLVTLTGPGGVGKTRLALEAARARADTDGPWLVELAGLHAPELLAATCATALGLPPTGSTDRLAVLLGGRSTLLVLDNCEHLLPSAAELVHTLLARCGGLRILATSREPLTVEGEAVLEVPPLPAATDAAELFCRRAAAAQPGWAPGPRERVRITGLCAGLDGIPLAVELAAAQFRTLSVGQIADALDDRFTLLTSAAAGRPARHRALYDTIAWSDQLLQPAERRLFHRLGVLAAGFDLETAAAVTDVTPVLAPLSALVRKSLLTVEPGSAPRRYRMLDTVRHYARNALAPGELARAERRHRAWALARAEHDEPRLRGPQGARLLDGLGRDRAEFRAAFASALAAGDADHALRLGGALFWYWFRRGPVTEGLAWLDKALAAAPDADPGTRARARFAHAGLSYLAGQTVPAHRAARTAAREARQAGDLVTEASALTYAAYFGALAGAPAGAAGLARTGVALARRTALRWLEAETLMVQGMLKRVLGDLPGADAVLREAVTAARSCGHDWAADGAAWCAMKTTSDRGDGAGALAIAGDVLAGMDRYGDAPFWLVTAHSAARALVLTGRPEEAAVLMGAVEAIGGQAGVSPESMDPLDGPREAAAVRRALPAQEYERHAARGRTLSREEAGALLAGLVAGR
ncbi:BTAD domain-containing putative transcriptional regulator [Streptomyces sp. NPDC047000]|uniref:AfsR/SARP family transcriptional regulator n=1 Tax=Streptomyces sp. NPDC047000 TaxID=3155474 RepID=UPI0033C4C528